jgi:hypothetical protein
MKKFALTVIIAMTLGPGAFAQWLTYPDPGIPRGADGKPNLTAPVSRDRDGRVDLSGVWTSIAPRALLVEAARDPTTNGAPPPFLNIENFLLPGSSLVMLPEAERLYRARIAASGAGRPSERCLPHGIPDAMLIPEQTFKILQSPHGMAILYEEFNYYRQIATDGRSHPKELAPTWFGYSVGTWDGDTLVVDTRGVNDQTWLDDVGHPHSDAMRTTERFRRINVGQMELLVTIDDAKSYRQPFTVRIDLRLLPDTDLIEHICDNEKFASTRQR